MYLDTLEIYLKFVQNGFTKEQAHTIVEVLNDIWINTQKEIKESYKK